jgi:hypothetical protein
MKKKLLLSVFEDEHKMIHALEELKDKGIEVFDCYTPFPVHGLDDLLKIKRTKLPIVTFFASSLGLGVALAFQYWVSVVTWPINVGGKPFNSLAAFIPVAFEITVLFGAFITIFAFLYRSSLFPKLNTVPIFREVTENHFVVALDLKDGAIDIEAMKAFFINQGALRSEAKGVVL